MALTNQAGNYIKIVNIDLPRSRVEIEIYETKNVYDVGPNEFQRVLHDTISCDETLDAEMDKPADDNKTRKEHAITAGYLALKALAQFADAEDA